MDITHNLKKLITGALASGAIAVTSLGLVTGTADAKPFYWCPGDPPPLGITVDAAGHTGNRVSIYPAWDTSVCHDYMTTGDHVKEGKACVLPQFQWFQCPPGTTPIPNMPLIPNKGE
jgi:hypothetical protein